MYKVWYYPQFQALTGALDVFLVGKGEGATAMYYFWYVTTYTNRCFSKRGQKRSMNKKRINMIAICLKIVILKNE